ncbi:MAG: hypothetical protein Q8O67_22500 [Deltaproteobacteria bacterium]|nr:hypothetical protein [Deltaproteobacteria bacterium]
MSWLLGPVDRFLLRRDDGWLLHRWVQAADPRAIALLGAHNVHLMTTFDGSPEQADELDRQLRTLYRVSFDRRDLRLTAADLALGALQQRISVQAACSGLDELRNAGADFIPFIFHAYNGEHENVLNWESALLFSALNLFDALADAPGVRAAVEGGNPLRR